MTPRQWAAVLGGLAGFNLWCAYGPRKGDGCLSPVLRSTFHTETTVGRVAFLTVLGGGVTWFAPHICGRPGFIRRLVELIDNAHTTEGDRS